MIRRVLIVVLLFLALPRPYVQSAGETCIYGRCTFEDGSDATEVVLTIYKPNGQALDYTVNGKYAVCPSAMTGDYKVSAHRAGYEATPAEYMIEALVLGDYKGYDFVFRSAAMPTFTVAHTTTRTKTPILIPSVILSSTPTSAPKFTPTFYWPTPPPIPTPIPTPSYTELTGTWTLRIGADGVCELALEYEGEAVADLTLWDGLLGDYLRGGTE